ncbi:MAG: hypothetical protein KDC54_21090 [Lewinella sp.]|nr:hypothetical protein [Lewinella sp.]
MKHILLPTLFALLASLCACQQKVADYVCPPCGLSCDTLTFSRPGACPHCGMPLLRKDDLPPATELVLNEIDMPTGSGSWLISDERDPRKTIQVYYHRPREFGETSQVLLVIPGAGRDADEYRDAWVEAAERYNVLILSPRFEAEQYGFEDYHLGGLIARSNLADCLTEVAHTNQVHLDEAQFDFELDPDSASWIFGAFDRIFELAVATLGTEQTSYDLFGHSAGGHILHRLTLFQARSKADRILASNASFYTFPTTDYPFPFGLRDVPVDTHLLQEAFGKKLVVFLGEQDNARETGGTFLRSATADRQGMHRLGRGWNFFQAAKNRAEELGYPFHWALIIVPGVGHDQARMAAVAAKYLYERDAYSSEEQAIDGWQKNYSAKDDK